MSLTGGKKSTTEEVTISNTSTNPVEVSAPNIEATDKLVPIGLGLDFRLRKNNYPEVDSFRSFYLQTDNISTTERTIGMPSGSNDDIAVRLTTAGVVQFTSTDTNDTSGGTGATDLYIEGLRKLASDGSKVFFDEFIVMNGQTPVLSTTTDVWRINKMFVCVSGSAETNLGDIYVSPSGASTTLGVPAATNTLFAMLADYGQSSFGLYTTATKRRFEFVAGNFWIDPTKNIRIHEFIYEDFSKADNFTKYEIGIYPADTTTYDYQAYEPYFPETDINLTCFTTSGSATALTYYVQGVLSNEDETNP